MAPDEFIKLLEERGDAVYIVDRGLIRFGKFALTLLAMFGIVGAFFFGLDVKKASDETKQARFDTEKTLLELTEAKSKLNSAKVELDQSKESFAKFINNARQEIQKSLDDADQSLKRTLGIEQEVAVIRLRVQQVDAAAALTSAKIEHPNVVESSGTVHIALVSEIKATSKTDLVQIAAALQKQVAKDLRPIWNIDATVEVFNTLQDVPRAYWPIIIKKETGFVGVGGIHSIKDAQPFAVVAYNTDFDRLTFAISRQLVAMLVDPSGNRVISAPSPNPVDNGKTVDVLVEIVTPMQGKEYGYRIDGVLVSDFVTPAFFDPSQTKGSSFSFNNAVKEPLSILNGGFLSWVDRETKQVWQSTWFDGSKPKFRNLGKPD
jgi:hypothetical protein